MSPHLLAVNFRDPAHPEAGGAELHLEHVLHAALGRGWRVTWLASSFPGAAPEADNRGMRIVRRGSWWNFNLLVPGILRREFSGASVPDRIVEDINKAPCLLPWFTRTPVSVIVPHLFCTTVFREANPLVGCYVLALEALIPHAYRGCPFLAISESTRDDLVARGVPATAVSVVHCGIDHERYRPDAASPKAARPTLVFVGRLRRYKGLYWVLRSLPAVLGRVPELKLEIVGDGPHAAALRALVARLELAHSVEFLGHLPGPEKVARLRAAWAVVQPSPKEGWGLTVMEASACGTAVVASDAPGLRDSVRDQETGLLVPYADDRALADALARVLTDEALRERLARAGVAWAARFRWEECGARSVAALTGEGSA